MCAEAFRLKHQEEFYNEFVTSQNASYLLVKRLEIVPVCPDFGHLAQHFAATLLLENVNAKLKENILKGFHEPRTAQENGRATHLPYALL